MKTLQNVYTAGDRRWSCAFTAPSSCSHTTLFMDMYQRTNRTNRTKIVRCFPHCCPRHRTRSYCCTSLHLTVTRPADGLPSPNVGTNELQVFARFRPVDEDPIRAREVIASSLILSSLQSSQDPTASWVTSRVAFRSQHSWLFAINPEAKWLYAWNSGATMAQRLTRHVVEAVVVAPVRDGRTFEVVAVTQSPSFTFTSFRHTAESDASGLEHSALFRALSMELQQQAFRHYDRPRIESSVARVHNATETPPLKRSTRSQPRQLMDLANWAARLSASEFAHLIPQWETHITSPARPKTTDAVSMAVHLAWWVHTDVSICRAAEQHSVQAVRDLGDPQMLRCAYQQWIGHLEERCTAFLERYGWSWGALVAQTMQHGPDSSSGDAAGLRRFIAAARYHAIYQSQPRQSPHPTLHQSWSCNVDDVQLRALDGERMTRIDHFEALTIGALCVFRTQLSCLSMSYDELTKCLRVVSSHPSSQSRKAGLELLLDHKYRCFASLPNGESALGASLLDDYSLGDYIGFPGWSGAAPRLYVTLFAWPRDDRPYAYRWHWTLRVPRADAPLHASVRVDAGDMSRRRTIETPPLETLRLFDKLALVERWTTQYDGLLPYIVGTLHGPTDLGTGTFTT